MNECTYKKMDTDAKDSIKGLNDIITLVKTLNTAKDQVVYAALMQKILELKEEVENSIVEFRKFLQARHYMDELDSRLIKSTEECKKAMSEVDVDCDVLSHYKETDDIEFEESETDKSMDIENEEETVKAN